MKGKVLFCLFILILFVTYAQKDNVKEAKGEQARQYVQNEDILKYDELLLWGNNMATTMAQKNYETSNVRENNLVERDYGYANILYSNENVLRIINLTMTRPNLACPRGVFLGNPIGKVEAYYHSTTDEYGEGLNYYYEAITETTEKYAYAMQSVDNIEIAACSRNKDGTFTYLKLEYIVQDGTVETIVYDADYTKQEEDMMMILEKAEKSSNI